MERKFSMSSGNLTLTESPQPTASTTSPHSNLFPRSKYSRDSISKDIRSSQTSVVLPHTITERHGGQELWVKAPVISGSLEKRGFRWRKKWKWRFVELDGRQLAYYESKTFCATTATSNGLKKHCRPKNKVMLTADAVLEDIDDMTWSLTPALKEMPWLLRSRDAATKERWIMALSDCIDILVWLRHYQLGPVLGVGGNGVVHQLQDERDATLYAVKVVDVTKFRLREQVVMEVEILRNITNNIKHPNLITIHKVYEEQEKVYIIQELCTGGELYDQIVQRGKFSERDAADIMRQLISALHALHEHNILHLDIKPENVLFSSKEPDSKIVLTDFGLARMINGKQNPLDQGKSMAGTVGYIAPEVLTSHRYSEAADVFSAGVILFILLMGYPPFYGKSEVEILLKIARGDYTFDPHDWAHVSASAKELVARMLELHAQDRITVDEILIHPWITRDVDQRNLDGAKDRDLTTSMMDKLQQFNIERKSQNMGSFVASMLYDDKETDVDALLDEKTIERMIRQLSVEGHSRIPLHRAHVLASGLGLSPYIDENAFIQFLDQNHDGFVDASDFCAGARAIRNLHPSFASLVFSAILRMNQHETKRDSIQETIKTPGLTREHFAVAFKTLACPEPLQDVFFKFIDDVEKQSHTAKTFNDSSWSVTEVEFPILLTEFSFIGMLFLRTAKDRVYSIVKSLKGDGMPRISED